MKILKCPECNQLIDSKDIKSQSVTWNPFTRSALQCINCGAKIKPKIWFVTLWWLWVVVGIFFMFSEYESPYTSLVIIGSLSVMVSLLRFGLSHESV